MISNDLAVAAEIRRLTQALSDADDALEACRAEAGGQITRLTQRVAELEEALRDALDYWQLSQRRVQYPDTHWSRRAARVLADEGGGEDG